MTCKKKRDKKWANAMTFILLVSTFNIYYIIYIWFQVISMEEDKEAGTEETDKINESIPLAWHLTFEEDRREIVMLWHLCHVSITHRSQFYLLFKGDPSDQIYMEVELRRLQWLEQHFSDLGNASPALLGDEPSGTVSAR